MTIAPLDPSIRHATFADVDDAFVQHFAEQGFALLARALNSDEVAAVNEDALRLCRGDYGPITYGHPSASAARAADVSGGNDEDLLRRYLCIHHPHKVSAAARASCLPIRASFAG